MNTPYNKTEAAIDYKHGFGSIIPLGMIALLLAGLFLSIVNDTYAFVKPDNEIIFTVDTPMPVSDFAKNLMICGVIKNDLIFLLYVNSKDKAEKLNHTTGQWVLNSNMSYREILKEIL